MWLVGAGVGELVGFSAIIQSLVRVHFFPVGIVFPLYLTLTSYLVNVISQPASHRVTTETSECAARPGMTYPCRALEGRSGIFRRHFSFDFTLLPSGKVTVIWSSVSPSFVASALVMRKLLVAPESSIAHWWILSFVSVMVSRSAFAAAL